MFVCFYVLNLNRMNIMYDENGNRRMFSVPVDGGLFADDAGRRRDSQVATFVCLEVASRRQQQFALAFNLEVMNRFR